MRPAAVRAATPATEVELKLRFPPDALTALLGHSLFAGEVVTKKIVSVYFDTPGLAIRAAGLSLRVRHVGGRRIQTIKALAVGAGLFERTEWVRDIDGDVPTAGSCADTPLARLLHGRAAVVPLFVIEIVRTVRCWRGADGAAVELALDRGAAVAGEARDAIFELELELKAGGHGAIFDLARSIAAVAPLWPSTLTKADIGYRLTAARVEAEGGGGGRGGEDPALEFLARHLDATSARAEIDAPGGAALWRAIGQGRDVPGTDIAMGLAGLSLVERRAAVARG